MLALTASITIAQNRAFDKAQKNYSNVGVETFQQLKKTNPFILDDNRLNLLYTIETYSDSYPPDQFRAYLKSTMEVAEVLEHEVPILYAYRTAFDKVLHELKTTKVKKGTAVVWLLYNMGFVVKTPSGAFGIDVEHRMAEQFAPHLDFLCITHNHGDHAHPQLMEAMVKLGKPVLSNFYEGSPAYLSKEATSYKIGEFTIRTDLSDHLADPKFPNFVTTYRIEAGVDADSFSILHCGDSGFNPAHFTNVDGPVDMVVLRWGAPRENNIFGTGKGQVQTSYAALSHLIELRHKPYPHGQASITQTLKHLPNVQCENTIIPFWGEKLTWKDGTMY